MELKKLLLKQKTIKGKKRIKCLLEIKSSRFDTRQDLADNLLVYIRTLERWVSNYKIGGIEQLMLDKPKNKQSKIITPAIHKGLEQRVNDPHHPFLGY